MTPAFGLALATLAAAPLEPVPVPTSRAQAVLEPAPLEPFHRLQPRRVTASSYLKSGWNQHEQNYLPPYVADDDPATAWVEGAAGAGEGQSLDWIGPTLKHARVYRVFLRNGYQKSKLLQAANARPARVRLQPLRAGTSPGVPWVPAGPAVEVELQDMLGWQFVDVPVAGQAEVAGLRLTILTTRAGKTYEDTCLSDLRVYVDGGDPHRPDVEAAAAEEIREFAVERAAAAKAGARKLHVELLPRYHQIAEPVRVELGLPAGVSTNSLTASQLLASASRLATGPQQERLSRAARAVALLESLRAKDRVPATSPAGWRRVSVSSLVGSSSAIVALQEVLDTHSDLPRRGALLGRFDSALLEVNGERQARARRASTALLGAHGTETCIATCRSILAAEGLDVAAWGSLDEACRVECAPLEGHEEEGERENVPRMAVEEIARNEAFADLDVSSYRHLYLAEFRDVGERDTHHEMTETLVSYDGDEAECVATLGRFDLGVTVSVLDWSRSAPVGGKPARRRLQQVTTFMVYLDWPGEVRFVETVAYRAEES